jgi:2-hydroxychromene-2-carboxylate isomerase
VPPTAGSSTADPLGVVRIEPDDVHPVFYADLSSPEAYLAAERVLQLVPPPCEWVPVLMPETGGFRCADERAIFAGELARRAAERRLQPFALPDGWPFDSEFAQRAATYAKGGGKTVAFMLAAFRQAYAGGRDLSVPEHVMIAAAACEIHPRALLKGAGTGAVTRQLTDATALARERGVVSTPAVWLPTGEVFHGDAGLDAAAAVVARLGT